MRTGAGGWSLRLWAVKCGEPAASRAGSFRGQLWPGGGEEKGQVSQPGPRCPAAERGPVQGSGSQQR